MGRNTRATEVQKRVISKDLAFSIANEISVICPRTPLDHLGNSNEGKYKQAAWLAFTVLEALSDVYSNIDKGKFLARALSYELPDEVTIPGME